MKRKFSISWISTILNCILILIPVLCSLLYFVHVVSSKLETTAESTATFYMEQFTNDTGRILDALRNTAYYLMSDPDTLTLMQNSNPPTQMERLKIEEGLGRMQILNQLPNSNIITGIYLIKDKEPLSLIKGGLFQRNTARIREVFQTYGDLNSARDLFVMPHDPDYSYFIVDYLDKNTMKPLGKLIIELNLTSFIQSANINTIYQDAYVLLRNTSGSIIASSSRNIEETIPTYNPKGYLQLGDVWYYHTSKVLSQSHIQVDVLIPHKEIFETIHLTVKVSVFFTLIVLFLALAASIILLSFLFKPLKQMVQKLELLAEGDLTVRMDSTPYKETNQVASTFNHMTDRMAELIDEVYEKGLLLRDAEIQSLDSQIEPHFIFNLLQLIHIRCMEAGQNHIARIVSNLAQLLRAGILHKNKQTICFADELQYVRYYLELQKERFHEKLEYSIDLEDDNISNYYLPKLTIQPLVENSIVHGLENQRKGGFVRISVWEERSEVCIRVTDNGVGFDPSSIHWNESAKDVSQTSHNHIALANINRRIKLLYGSKYGIHITSAKGNGSEVLVTLPIDLGPV